MLVLTRKENESIMIGNEIEVKVLDLKDNQVKIGIVAPRAVAVHRREVYLAIQAENAQAAANSQAGKRRSRTATESQKARAETKKDELDDALGDLNRSTNRLRRKFDATDTWMQTKAEVERVIDDGRKINQVVARGSYGAEAARLWAVLRTGMNDLARVYGVTPLGI